MNDRNYKKTGGPLLALSKAAHVLVAKLCITFLALILYIICNYILENMVSDDWIKYVYRVVSTILLAPFDLFLVYYIMNMYSTEPQPITKLALGYIKKKNIMLFALLISLTSNVSVLAPSFAVDKFIMLFIQTVAFLLTPLLFTDYLMLSKNDLNLFSAIKESWLLFFRNFGKCLVFELFWGTVLLLIAIIFTQSSFLNNLFTIKILNLDYFIRVN